MTGPSQSFNFFFKCINRTEEFFSHFTQLLLLELHLPGEPNPPHTPPPPSTPPRPLLFGGDTHRRGGRRGRDRRHCERSSWAGRFERQVRRPGAALGAVSGEHLGKAAAGDIWAAINSGELRSIFSEFCKF